MLFTGFKGGNVLSNLLLNKIIQTAEQLTNINVCSHIKGLSNDNGLGGENTIYHKQERNRLTLVAVYFSTSAITSTYPSLLSAIDMNGTSYTASFTSPVTATETFDFVRDGTTYKLTIMKTTYTVALAARKRLQFVFKPVNPKSWASLQLNSMYIIQHDSNRTYIFETIEENTSTTIDLNLVKEAFRKRQSYNLVVEGLNNNYAQDDDFFKIISVQEDLHEFGMPISIVPRFVRIRPDGTFPEQITFSTVAGSNFSYTVVNKTDANFLAFNRLRLNNPEEAKIRTYGVTGVGDMTLYYLYVNDTENKAIDSINNDALNGYELTKINNDYVNRLQGKLVYPILGPSIISTEVIGSLPFDMVIKNNVDNFDYNLSFTLTSGYPVKFAII